MVRVKPCQVIRWHVPAIRRVWANDGLVDYFHIYNLNFFKDRCILHVIVPSTDVAWSVITDQRYKERDCFWSPKLNCISSFFFFWPELNYSKSVKAESFAWGADIPRKDQHAAPERWGCRQRLLLSVMIRFVFLLFLLVYINRNNSRYISIRHNRWA